MIKTFTFCISLISLLGIGQTKIDSTNYYSFFKDHNDYKKLKVEELRTGRLMPHDILKVLNEEMKLAGLKWLNNYQIIQIDNEKYITAICYSEKSKFGFVLEENFEAIPIQEHRNIKSLTKERTGNDYIQKILSPNGESKFIEVKELPENLALIKSDIYWFQTTENAEINKTLVTKEIAIEILRNDVKKILKSIKIN